MLLASLSACGTSSSPSGDFSGGQSASGIGTGVNELPAGYNMLTGLPGPEGLLEGQRPAAVIVSNDIYSLPQRGLASADVLYEMVTEGGITRLMAMYADYRSLPLVGPVRSIRDQQVQLAVPINAILVHVGSSPYARNLLNVLEYQNIDGIYLGSTAFVFDEALAQTRRNEYCYFTNAELMWRGMERLDVLTTGVVPPLFSFGEARQGTDAAERIDVTFSPASYCSFEYNARQGLYLKNIFDAPHADEDGSRLAFTNVIILSTAIGLKVDQYCTDFDFSGGTGVYFVNGAAQEITWVKGSPESPLLLFDKSGNMLQVQPGKSYIGVIADDGTASVTYSAGGVPPDDSSLSA